MTSNAPAPHTPAGVLEQARAQVLTLTEQLWAAKTPADLLEANLAIEKLRSTLAAVQAQVAVEIDAVEAQKADGWASAADYLTRTCGGRQSAGRRLLHTATALTAGGRDATRDALAAGQVSPEHAEVIVACLDLLPVDGELRAVGEKFLLEHAAALNATELDKLGRELLEVLDPDGVAAREEKKLHRHERSAHLNRFLAFVGDGLGGVRVKGRGTVEDAAVIQTALQSLAAPAPAPGRQRQPAPTAAATTRRAARAPTPTMAWTPRTPATTEPAPGTRWSRPANASPTPRCCPPTTAASRSCSCTWTGRPSRIRSAPRR